MVSPLFLCVAAHVSLGTGTQFSLVADEGRYETLQVTTVCLTLKANESDNDYFTFKVSGR